MENTYLVNSADLTSVADAIRMKGETGEPLVFPSGFVTAIENIKGGGDLNFEVVGGETQPSSPKENTIWVNTPNEITGWCFSLTEPTEAVDGMIWFEMLEKGYAPFNALKENAIIVKPFKARQKETDAWVSVPAKTYINGAWIDWLTYLINGSDPCNEITGGWSAVAKKFSEYGSTAKAPTVTTQPDGMTIVQSSGTGGFFHSKNKIDVSSFDKLTLVGYATTISDEFVSIRLYSSIGTYQSSNTVALKSIPKSQTGDFSVSLDISGNNLTGSYYVGLTNNSAMNLKIKALYLE